MKLPVVTFIDTAGVEELHDFAFVCPGQGVLKRILLGSTVLLIDGRTSHAIGFGRVTNIVKGELKPLCLRFGREHHKFKRAPGLDPIEKGEALFSWLESEFGKGIIKDSKKSVVLMIEKYPYESGPEKLLDVWATQREVAGASV